ncbi:hypothetical protein [Brevibacterium otitidis]|uniref:DUF2975 domain-containing protein n=1 Tax=Brevibacterium otitidis TaxID=53364 RepID=A0ABV5X4E5_9MICO|nr:hypothetical protein GCM10023233_23200 [Brevibacterium otitidis]
MSGKRRKRGSGGDDSLHFHPGDADPTRDDGSRCDLNGGDDAVGTEAGAGGIGLLDPGTPLAVRPWTLWLAIAMVALEAIVLIVSAIFFVRTGAGVEPQLRSSLYGLAVMFVIMSTGLMLVARSLHRMRRWARPATVAWQLLQALFGLSMWGAGALLQVGAIVPAVLCLAGLFSPATIRAYERALGAASSEQHLDTSTD